MCTCTLVAGAIYSFSGSVDVDGNTSFSDNRAGNDFASNLMGGGEARIPSPSSARQYANGNRAKFFRILALEVAVAKLLGLCESDMEKALNTSNHTPHRKATR